RRQARVRGARGRAGDRQDAAGRGARRAGGRPCGTGAVGRLHRRRGRARVLAAVAEEAGLVLVLDDVQWADADSLALLAHVTREVTRGRLLVVVTVRPAERDLALGGLVIELFGWDDAE